MSEEVKNIRLSKAAREFNVGTSTIVEFLAKKGQSIDPSPNTKLTPEQYALVVKEYQGEKEVKKNADQLGNIAFKGKTITVETTEKPKVIEEEEAEVSIKSNILTKKAEPKTEPVKKEKKEEKKEVKKEEKVEAIKLNVVGKIDLDGGKKAKEAKDAKEQKGDGQPETVAKKEEVKQPKEEKPVETKKPEETKSNFIPTQVKKLEGPKILDKIELPVEYKGKGKPVATSGEDKKDKKKKRKRIGNGPVNPNEIAGSDKPKDGKGGKQGQGGKPGKDEKRGKDRFKKGKQPIFEEKPELTDEEIKKQIKETLARLEPMGKSKTSKHRREKRHNIQNELEEERMHEMEEQKVLKVTEFVTANELATLMNIPVTKVIATCMSLGMFVSINQRLDAEILQVVAEEFGFKVEFQSLDVQEAIAEADEPDAPEDLVPRAPVVTVMGHVDHGKTKLLDFIRSTNVVAGEAGGITQHIGAYEVKTSTGKKITFLDTPGHEAFTAMRARGAKITDVAIIVIAADDNVMPQTVEAINHAHAANVPIVFAINKIDKPTADPQKIYRQLADMNILVEEWGGKVQSQEISAKQGIGVDELLEKVLLEAEMLDLKGNPNRLAKGTVIESALDKGRGYVAKVLVQDGTLRVGDMVLAGTTYGKVKAMFNERNQPLKEAGPSTPLLLLGLNGAPQAGDNFNVMTDEREVKTIANRRQQLQREMGIRTQKHITLDEIGRRIAIGDFKELNIIVKADVDGSVEALSDSLLKLSTEEVQVNIIHKSVGAISEADIMLASASNAVIVGFNVRPTMQARKIAEREQIDIRLYSIIYTAIEEIKAAIEGMLSPEIQEVVTCNIEIREVFHISKVGNIAGCMVLDGKVNRQTKIRLIRDGIVVHTGTLGSLKRFKDDVKEVSAGFECGLNIENFNDIKVGDIIEGYTEKEVSRKL